MSKVFKVGQEVIYKSSSDREYDCVMLSPEFNGNIRVRLTDIESFGPDGPCKPQGVANLVSL